VVRIKTIIVNETFDIGGHSAILVFKRVGRFFSNLIPLRKPSKSTVLNPRHSEHKRHRRLIKGCRSFNEFSTRVEGLTIKDKDGNDVADKNAQGDAMEVFAEALVNTSELFLHQNVIPIERKGDRGVDATAQRPHDSLPTSIQIKYTADMNKLHSWNELSTFYGKSAGTRRVLITAGKGMGSKAVEEFTGTTSAGEDEPPLTIINRASLDALEEEDWKRIEDFVYSTPQMKRSPMRMRPHQKIAFDEVFEELQKEKKTTLVMPPGTGKTLVGLRIAESMVAGEKTWTVLALVPGLSLLDQQLRYFVNNTQWPIGSFRILAVGSGNRDREFNEDEGDLEGMHMDPANMLEPPTTIKEDILEFLNSSAKMKLVFSTYQSSDVVRDAAIESGTKFNIAVYDEAHNCTKEEGLFSTAVHDSFPALKRLFMTATPRKVMPIDDSEEADEIFTMADIERFGKISHRLSLSQALKVEPPIIVPFEIVICKIDSTKNAATLQQLEASIVASESGGRPLEGSYALKLIAIHRVMQDLGISKAITFHRYVAWAKAFVSTTKGLPAVGFEGKAFSIDGNTPTTTRQEIFREFETVESAVLSNCQCLSEGVDAPAVEMVAFMDAKKSPIDIVQAAGRAFRTSPSKERAYIFLPIVVDEGQGETEIIATLKQQDFAHVGHVLAAMFESDEEFQEYLNSIYYTQVVTPDIGYKPGTGKSRSGSGFTVRDADTREEMVAGDLRNMLTAAVVRTVVPNFERNMQRFLAYKEKYKTGYVPQPTTAQGKKLLQEISPEFLYWAHGVRIAYGEVRRGATLPHKGITQQKYDRLIQSGFAFSSTTDDKRGKSSSLAGKKQPRYADLEPLIVRYHNENNGEIPPAYGPIVAWNNQTLDLGKAVGQRISKINRNATMREKDEYVALFKRLGYLDSEDDSENSKDSADE